MFMFMPWGINQAYENRQQFLRDQQASMIEQPQKAEDVQREGGNAKAKERIVENADSNAVNIQKVVVRNVQNPNSALHH